MQRFWTALLYAWSRCVSLPVVYLSDWVFKVERAIADQARADVPGRPAVPPPKLSGSVKVDPCPDCGSTDPVHHWYHPDPDMDRH